jgi:tetratricopeptide (TPR) repeat protein
VRADGDNLRASLEWFAQHDPATGLTFASNVGRYWVFRGSMDEGLAWYDTLLQRAGPVEQAPRAQLRASLLANYGGHPTVSRRLAEQSLEAYRHRGDAHGAALATGVLGDLDLRGALQESVRHSREAAATLELTGDSYYLSYVLDNLAGGLLQLGDFAEAERTVRRAIAIARQHGHPYRLAVGIRILASILRLRGDLVAADRLLAESDSLATGLDDVRFGATWFAEWAVVAAGHGDIERALDLAAVALTKATQRADRAAMGWALWAEGEVRLTAGEQAAEPFAQALTKIRHHSFPLRRIEVLTGLALAVDQPDIAAAAAAAAVAVRDEQHMVLPAGIAARLDNISKRWTSIVGTDPWAQRVSDLSTRPHDQLLDLLTRRLAARAL